MKLGMSMLAGQVLWQGAAWCVRHSPSGQDSRPAWLSHCARKWRRALPSGHAAASPCVASSCATPSRAARCAASPRPRLISVTRRAARANSARTGGVSPSAFCQWRYRARPVCLTTHTPAAITIRLDGAGMMPADAKDSASHDRSALEYGRKPPRPSSKTSTASSPGTSTPPPQLSIWFRRLPDRASATSPRCFMPRRSVSNEASRPDAPANSKAIRHQVSGVWISRDPSATCLSPQQLGPL